MGLLIVHHRVKSFSTWRAGFDRHASTREAAGLTNGQVFQSSDDPNDVIILLEMADLCRARDFVMSEGSWTAMLGAGVIDMPMFHFLTGPAV